MAARFPQLLDVRDKGPGWAWCVRELGLYAAQHKQQQQDKHLRALERLARP